MPSRSPGKKRGRGVANNKPADATALTISPTSTLGNGLALKSSRSVMSAPLHLEANPTAEQLITRLADSLAPSWESFVRMCVRNRKSRARSFEEKWLAETQSRVGALLSRLHSQETAKISTALPLFIAYDPVLEVSVCHEVGLPGFSAPFLAQHTSCKFNAGAFSPPMDSTQSAPQSLSHASDRFKTTLKYLSDLIKDLEAKGAHIVAMYYNERNELRFYRTSAFKLSCTETPGVCCD